MQQGHYSYRHLDIQNISFPRQVFKLDWASDVHRTSLYHGNGVVFADKPSGKALSEADMTL